MRIVFGEKVMADEIVLGEVHGVALDPETLVLTHIIIQHGLLQRKTSVPFSAILADDTGSQSTIHVAQSDGAALGVQAYPLHGAYDPTLQVFAASGSRQERTTAVRESVNPNSTAPVATAGTIGVAPHATVLEAQATVRDIGHDRVGTVGGSSTTTNSTGVPILESLLLAGVQGQLHIELDPVSWRGRRSRMVYSPRKDK